MKINKDIRKSNTLDGDFYCSNEMFEIVRKNIFDRSWQFVCSSEELSQNNSTFPFYFLDESTLFLNLYQAPIEQFQKALISKILQ